MRPPHLTRTDGYWNLISPSGQPAGIFVSLTTATAHLAGMRSMIWRTPVDTCKHCSSELTHRPTGPHQKKPSARTPGVCGLCLARLDAGIPTPDQPCYACRSCGTRVDTGYGRPHDTRAPGTTGRCNTCSRREDGPTWRTAHEPIDPARAAHLAGRQARAQRSAAATHPPALTVARGARGWEVRTPEGKTLTTCPTLPQAQAVAGNLTARRRADAARAAA